MLGYLICFIPVVILACKQTFGEKQQNTENIKNETTTKYRKVIKCTYSKSNNLCFWSSAFSIISMFSHQFWNSKNKIIKNLRNACLNECTTVLIKTNDQKHTGYLQRQLEIQISIFIYIKGHLFFRFSQWGISQRGFFNLTTEVTYKYSHKHIQTSNNYKHKTNILAMANYFQCLL